jgi:ArsR family transcriptional regulator, arsenate/arsenite/antimonite-responsive transcriptional repressor
MNKVNVFKALGNSTRLKILESIKNKSKCICEIIPQTGKSQPNVSYHIAILKNADLISENRKGSNIFIQVINKNIFEIIDMTGGLKK